VAGAASEESVEAAEITLPEDLTKPEVRDLISRLSDDQVRALLISQLDKLASAESASASEVTFEESLANLYRRSAIMWVAIPELPHLASFIVEKLTEGRTSSYLWSVLLFVAAIFFGAGAVEWVFRRLFKRLGQIAQGGEIKSVVDRLWVAGLHLVIDLVAIGVFALTAVAIFFAFYERHEPTGIAISTVFWVIVYVRIIIAVSGFLLSPGDSGARLLPLDDETARHSHRRAVLIGVMLVGAIQLMNLLRKYELAEGPTLAMGAILTLLFLCGIIILVWRDRKIVAALISPSDIGETAALSPAREFFAANWHVFTSCYILGLGLFGVTAQLLTGGAHREAIIVSLCLLPAVPIMDWLARLGIRRLCESSPRDQDEDGALDPTVAGEPFADLDAVQGEEEHVSRTQPEAAGLVFEPVLIRNMRVILGLLVFLLMAQVWGFDLHNVTAANMSERVADALFEIVVILIVAWAAWGFVKTAITYYAPQEGIDVGQMVEGDAGGTGLSRAQTLLPLLRKFILISLIVIVALVVLSSLGVSIGPLIAGAGVIGLAIGFGAQTLVRDIISGAFFLADDAFRLGEYIDVGVAMGMVERISVRSFRLRHHLGPINTVPFGEVQKVTNFSRDWVMMKLQMRVPSDTDLEKLRKVVKKVGQEMMEEPEFSDKFLQPVKSQGVYRMDDDGAFVIRIKFMSRPGEQFVLRREVFRRVQEAFAENGIRFAPKRVMIDAGEDVSEKQIAAAAIAAETAAKDEPH
jgi:small-conductance mechanosensitive channel